MLEFNGTEEEFPTTSRFTGFQLPQSTSPAKFETKMISSIMPSHIKKAQIPYASNRFHKANLRGVVPLPWWRRPRKGKRPTPFQSQSPVSLSKTECDQFLREFSRSVPGSFPFPVQETGFSMIESRISSDMYDKTIKTLRKMFEKRVNATISLRW